MGFSIDTGFDVYSDTPAGKDPDSHSPTLRRYHEWLWSKPLPDGRHLALTTEHPKAYLNGKVGVDELFLSSDGIAHSYRFVDRMAAIIGQMEKSDLDEFYYKCSTVGAYILFPSRSVDRAMTINQARGCHPRIGDRFDLTLECIRRQYIKAENPLHKVLGRYEEFFQLFKTFEGYVEFFLLQDMLLQDGASINFYLDFNDFTTSPFPSSVEQYRFYCDRVIGFITARNSRIEKASRAD